MKIHREFFVRLIGLEPTRRETPDPKSGASTNFATGALFGFRCAKLELFSKSASVDTKKCQFFYEYKVESKSFCNFVR